MRSRVSMIVKILVSVGTLIEVFRENEEEGLQHERQDSNGSDA